MNIAVHPEGRLVFRTTTCEAGQREYPDLPPFITLTHRVDAQQIGMFVHQSLQEIGQFVVAVKLRKIDGHD